MIRAISAALQVYLVTIGQGELYWEKYGHNMLWFVDSAAGVNVAYNWGTFDFNQPGFLRRMLVGDPLYSVEGIDGDAVLEHYRGLDRTITLQRLNLSDQQARLAFERSRINALPANKNYRYDYYLDNCSTRVRDMIDAAVNGQLRAVLESDTVPVTYKSETVRLLDDLALTQFGVQVALGRPADVRLTMWESGFIPMRLRDAIRDVEITHGEGPPVPLVADERVIYRSTQFAEREVSPSLWLRYLVIGLLLAGVFLAVALAAPRASGAEKVFRVSVGMWGILTGIAGVLLLVAWTSTRHEFWYRNENLLLLNPLSLFLGVLAFMALARERWMRPAAVTAAIVALLAALALILKGTPGFAQHNLPIVLMLAPTHFVVAWALKRRVPR